MRYFFLLCFFLLFLCGCNATRNSLILFNNQPIVKENLLKDKKFFLPNERVYYVFLTEKKLNNDYIRVQVFKMTDKASFGGAEVIRTKDFRLMKNEGYYFTDYFVFYEPAHYVLQVFSHDDFTRPLAVNDFYIK